MRATLLVVLALTWLNPHVYLDTLMLLGAVSAQYPDKLAFGAGAETRSVIGIVVISGVSMSMILTLFVIPVLYSLTC